jgi:uncharacterized protein YwqG
MFKVLGIYNFEGPNSCAQLPLHGQERKTEPIKEHKKMLSKQVTFEQALKNEVLFVSYSCCDYFDFSTIFG